MTDVRKTHDDPAIDHLTQVLRKAVAIGGGFSRIHLYDGEEKLSYSDPAEAAKFAKEIDGPILYRVDKITLGVIYDGPYTADTAPEIIYDHNDAASAVIDAS